MEINAGDVMLELRGIVKSFGNTEVLKGIDLTVRKGDFVTLLGSSGCGKTTLLRIIAGLTEPDAGEVLLEGKNICSLPPEKRDVNTIFQSYALFPHMNVAQNVGYALKIRGVEKSAILRRVGEMLALVQMEGSEKKTPAQLSGGQRQRIAIARSLINNPKVLLLDEPLGALDLQLRRQMQYELKKLQKQLGTTFIYVTHDQEEAINLSDKIVLLHDGGIEQQGEPNEIYDHPHTSYAARFVGNANILQGRIKRIDGGAVLLENECGTMFAAWDGGKAVPEDALTLAVRGENVVISREPAPDAALCGVVEANTFAGGMLRIPVRLCNGGEVIITRQGIHFDFSAGETVYLRWEPSAAVLVDREEAQS
ncbi:MAG: ABC transporter ATP-binding protein [Oscillospiraceae bacterium]|nr:ABC transporter ATP-binding protein [Oscillospiraceae bacterium]